MIRICRRCQWNCSWPVEWHWWHAAMSQKHAEHCLGLHGVKPSCLFLQSWWSLGTLLGWSLTKTFKHFELNLDLIKSSVSIIYKGMAALSAWTTSVYPAILFSRHCDNLCKLPGESIDWNWSMQSSHQWQSRQRQRPMPQLHKHSSAPTRQQMRLLVNIIRQLCHDNWSFVAFRLIMISIHHHTWRLGVSRA